jgi:hypothetical protein
MIDWMDGCYDDNNDDNNDDKRPMKGPSEMLMLIFILLKHYYT